jgi:hypothetical protein
MVRQAFIVLAGCLFLAACGRNAAGPSAGLAELRADIAGPSSAQQFSYRHVWSLEMAKDTISPRFERARARCLQDKTLNCRLVSANISTDNGASFSFTSADLEVLLPHDKIGVFEKSLSAPLPGRNDDRVIVQSRSTHADSVENEAGDATRKVSQLAAYRDRLALLARRPNLSIEDVIRLEAEQSRVQEGLDDAIGKQRDLNEGVARERVNVMLSERPGITGPIAQVWRNAMTLLIESTASALQFTIQVIPWLPIVGAGIYLASWLWRLFRRRQKAQMG